MSRLERMSALIQSVGFQDGLAPGDNEALEHFPVKMFWYHQLIGIRRNGESR
jgi:hypothetical protein